MAIKLPWVKVEPQNLNGCWVGVCVPSRDPAYTIPPHPSFQVRLLHFNLRRGPENYELRTCSVEALTVDLFCTWGAFLVLLCQHFSYRSSQGLASPHLCTLRRDRLKLEWVPRPDELPQDQYDKQRFRGLMVADPKAGWSDDVMNREVTTMKGFVEELLKLALAEGFRLDLVLPDPADVLNSTSLRLVKY